MTEDTHRIRVAIAGAAGHMGTEAVKALRESPRFKLAGLLVRSGQAIDNEAPVFHDAETLLTTVQPDVWLDLTDARSVIAHVDLAIAHGVRPVVGATGYTMEDVQRWTDACDDAGIGGVVAPNFAVGALLMMRLAEQASRHFEQAEIIELHHDKKKDAPSGTAKRTAQMIGAQLGTAFISAEDGVLRNSPTGHSSDTTESRSRGERIDDVPVHSVRLPGLVAHQEVLFGGTGEILSIRHDSTSRSSFMPGILLACAKVMELRRLVYGLDHLLW